MTECGIQILHALLLRHQFTIGVLNDTIFACGGMTTNATLLDSCEQFIASASGTGGGRWSMISARLPFPVTGHAMAATGGKLYLIGGAKTASHTGTLDTDTMLYIIESMAGACRSCSCSGWTSYILCLEEVVFLALAPVDCC